VKFSLSSYVSERIAEVLASESVFGAHPVIPYQVEAPRQKRFGDLSSNVAMVAAGIVGKPPMELAELIAGKCRVEPSVVRKIEVSRPGFVNFFLEPAGLIRFLEAAALEADSYGLGEEIPDERIQVEFVSANPTGPLNVVSARAAAVGDSLVRLLRAAGYRTKAEFYVNDAGRQVELLGLSFEARLKQHFEGQEAAIPEGGYPGEYILELAKRMSGDEARRILAFPESERKAKLAARAVDSMLSIQKRELERFGVVFDEWFRESALHSAGETGATLEALRSGGGVAERDGAVWLRSSAYGDTEDRVLVRSTGQPTYLLSDIAYHRNKFNRGFTRVIDIWGPDHHGHIPRMKAAAQILGFPADWLEVLIVQWVRLLREGRVVKMSKRAGEFVTMEELLDEVGRDCARFFFLMRRTNSHLDFDLDLARKQSDENPAYYVQYAHARISSILEFAAAERGLSPDARGEAEIRRLGNEEEFELMKAIAFFPDTVRAAARAREPHRIPIYLQSLAAEFHRFYTKNRVVSSDMELSKARLRLVWAVRTVLKNGLTLIGVSAPEKM